MVSFRRMLGQYTESEQVQVFNDTSKHLPQDPTLLVPSKEDVAVFIKRVFQNAQMVEECIIMSLVYLERLLKAKKGKLMLHARNWQPIVLSCMVLASKVWDDLSMQNGDFSMICPSYSLKRINELEVALLELIEYNVRISSSTYAKYYFQLRAIGKEMGIYSSEESEAEALNSLDAIRLETATFGNFPPAAASTKSEENPIKSSKEENDEIPIGDKINITVNETPAAASVKVDPPGTSASVGATRRELQKTFGTTEMKRRRRKTVFSGASSEWMQHVHEKGYLYTAAKSVNLASLEQCVSLNYSGTM